MTRDTAVPATEHKPEHTTEYSCTKVVHVTVTDTPIYREPRDRQSRVGVPVRVGAAADGGARTATGTQILCWFFKSSLI